MRVLLSTIGSRGDVQPLVALALALGARGHEPRLCAPPDFREWIESFRLPFTPIGPEIRTTTAPGHGSTPPVFTPERRRQLAEGTVATQFETVGAAARGCDVIVAATALQIAARSLAENIGIGYVFAAYTPTVLPSPHHPPPALPPLPDQTLPPTTDNRELWARDGARFNDLFGSALNAHRASLGLPPVSDVRGHMFTDRPWLAADPTLGPWPAEDDGVVQTGAWMLPDDRPLPADLERFLDTGDAPVYFGFGSMRPPDAPAQVLARVDAARAVGRRAIVSAGWADLSALDGQSDCLVITEANLQALFPRVAAVVHHGGAGTTTLAGRAGAPQVIIPQVYDQHYWARRVGELGIGTTIALADVTTESLTGALAHALQSDVVDRAHAIARAIRSDGAEAAARRLESFGQR